MYYSETEARKLVIEAGLRLLENKLIARTWGNISARISKDEFIITPSGKAYDRLTPADLVKVRVSDGSYSGSVKPSSEKGVHAAAYSLRNHVGFIIHTHQYYASAVAAECRNIRTAPCAAYALPGTTKLKKHVAECIKNNPYEDMFLMARHGTLILGADMDEAFAKAEALEDKCKGLVEARVKLNAAEADKDFDTSKVNIRALPFVKVVSDPYIMKCCEKGKTVGAYIDDFAMIVGPDMQVIECDEWAAERVLLGYSTNQVARGLAGKVPMTGALDRMGGQQPALNSAIGRNAVLVKGIGAVCAGKTRSDAEAIAMIVSKNCAAACYTKYAKPLGSIDSRLQRYIYLTKYSRQMDA
ncbi:MAG: class II aldolase/adducin family protein [Mogibacterium sp.]|nr:class II aldolase/adducin family protein [Mogibacterium sp.]MBQ6502027.1 class II aldolase/adducin family protein [Mogibacterium sp.]